jgi:hypothetical protein
MELHRAAVEEMRRAVSESDGEQRFDVARLRSLPRPVASRVVRLALCRILTVGDGPAWTSEAVDAVLDLAEGRPGRRRDLPAGLKARRERGYVSVSRTSPESRV